MEVTSTPEYTFASSIGFSGGHPISGRNVPDVLNGRREEILINRREVKAQTLARRKRYNHLLRESNNTAVSP